MAEIDAYGDIVIPGQGGPQGPAGEIVGADAVTLETGQAATVSMGGTPSKRVLHFGLPRGEKSTVPGPPGDVTPEALAAQHAAEAARDGAVLAKTDSEAAAKDAQEAVDRIDYSDSGWKPIVSGGGGLTLRPGSGYRILNGVAYLAIASDGPLVNGWQTLARLPKTVAPANITPLSYSISGSGNGPTVRAALYPNDTDCSVELFSNSTTPALTHYVSGSWVVPPK